MQGPGQKAPPIFSKLHERHGPGPSGSGEDEYLLLDDTEGGGPKAQLNTRAPLIPQGSGAPAMSLARQEGARHVMEAIALDYGRDVAAAVLGNVREEVHRTAGRLIDQGMTRGDLGLIHQELQYHQELRMLQGRVRVAHDTPNVIKGDLAEDRASTIEKYYRPSGAAKVELLQSYMQRYTMQFDSKEGTLILTRGAVTDKSGMYRAADGLAALAGFIDMHFGVKPGDPAFRNIANNILLYLPLDAPSAIETKMQRVAAVGWLSSYPDRDVVQNTVTLTASKDGEGNTRGVGVACDTRIPYTKPAYGPIDFSRYRFVRREEFEISSVQLRSDPLAFDARANLARVTRLDTIQSYGELQKLRDRVPRDEPGTIKDELAEVWRSPPDVIRASRWWPSDEGQPLIATVVTLGYLQRAELRYDEAAGTLRVTQRVGFVDAGLLEANMTALTAFIHRHFGAEPGRLSFAYIASNIISYLPQGKPTSMPDKMQAVAGDAARPDVDAARSMFTFSVNKDVVGVVGDTDIPFEVIGDGGAGPDDFSKFRFARHEEFEISRERLGSAPTVFDPRANLVSVKRVDTIDWANSR